MKWGDGAVTSMWARKNYRSGQAQRIIWWRTRRWQTKRLHLASAQLNAAAQTRMPFFFFFFFFTFFFFAHKEALQCAPRFESRGPVDVLTWHYNAKRKNIHYINERERASTFMSYPFTW